MIEKIYIISDTEMGRGDITDDFSDDQILANFINKINNQENEKITLVLNGDIFDFLKMAYKGNYPRYITEPISMWKLEEVIRNHRLFFETLKNFLAKTSQHRIFFVIGNHDHDLAWPSLREKIKKTLNNHNRVDFSFHYDYKDIHAEHGHLVDSLFKFDHEKPIITYKKEKILNLPWGSQICFKYLVKIKKLFPLEERLFPKPMALMKNKKYRRHTHRTVLKIIIKEILINPILRFYDPTYYAPFFGFFKHLVRNGLEVIDDSKLAISYIKDVIKKVPHKKVIALGHLHLNQNLNYRKRRILITDTWRNELDINKNLAKKQKSYAEIIYDNNKLTSAEVKIFSNEQ